MTEPASAPGSGSTAGPSGVAVMLWGVMAAVIIGIVAAGAVFLRGERREPPPVIAQVPEFSLVGTDGRAVTRDDFAGGPWVVDFIFTRCAAICPRMTQQLRQVAAALPAAAPVRIVSISVDPEHDTPEVLAAYAEAHGASGDWQFLTGETEEIEALTRGGFLLPLDRMPAADLAVGADPVIHSNRFVLVDGEARIRGYYDAFDPTEIERLLADLRTLLAKR